MTTTQMPAHEAKVWEPSTFASRRAENVAAGRTELPQRIATLGVVKTPLDMPGRAGREGGAPRIVDIEYFFDVDHPAKRYRRVLPYGALERLDRVTGAEDSVQDMGFIPRSSRPAGAFAPAADDPPPERVS